VRLWAIILLAAAAAALGPASRPVTLEVRAAQEFIRGEYAAALPLLQKLYEQSADDPDKRDRLAEQIRVCVRNLRASGRPVTRLAVPEPATQPRRPHLRPPDGQALDLPVKDLGNFVYDDRQGGNVPPDVLKLDGVQLRTRGYMMPLDQADNITEFALVADLLTCCFGQPPQVHHTLVVRCAPGKAVAYFADELIVEGRLRVQEKKDDGYVISLFELEASSVRPAPRKRR